MIRKAALAVISISLLFLLSTLFSSQSSLGGNVVVMQCEDSDLTEENDPVAGTVFSSEDFKSINYAVPGKITGIHPQFKTQATLLDTCLSSTTLKEFYCDVGKNVLAWAEEKCPSSARCHAGACVHLLCRDLDGFNVTRNATLIYTSTENEGDLVTEDYCESPTQVVEFVCQNYDISKGGNVLNVYAFSRDLRQAVHYKCPSG